MPVNRPGAGVYVTNGSTVLTHGQPVTSSNYVGVAVKQKVVPWSSGLSPQAEIASGEDYFIITKGLVQVTHVSGFAKGDAVYITSANVLTETASGNTKYGRVHEVQTARGTPSGKVRIDLDAKDSVA
jgi:hypothetical protein